MPALGLALGLPFARPSVGGGFVGPLDDYTTDLVAAYLPFLGFASYAGNCFTIRDTTGDAEQNVGFEGDGSLSAYTVTGNAAIKTWHDQSGADADLSQSTGSLQPLLTLNIVNGKAVARLDGTDDIMEAVITAAPGTVRTVYAIGKKRSAQTVASAAPLLYLDTNLASICADSGNIGWGYVFNQGFSQVGHTGTPTDWTVITLKVTDESTAVLYANNTAGASFDPYSDGSHSPLRGGLKLGGTINTFADADCAGILVYNALHNDTTRQAIQTILADAFNITLA